MVPFHIVHAHLKNLFSHYWVTLQYMLKYCLTKVFLFVFFCGGFLFVFFARPIWLSARKIFSALIFIINHSKYAQCTMQPRFSKCFTMAAV